MMLHNNQHSEDYSRTVELRAHTQSVGGGARQFWSWGQVSIGQSLLLQARCNLTGRVTPNSSTANRVGIWVILSHWGQQQRNIVALWSYHGVFRRLIRWLGPAPRLLWNTREKDGKTLLSFTNPSTLKTVIFIPLLPHPEHCSELQHHLQSKAHGCPNRARPPSESVTPTSGIPQSHHAAHGPPKHRH